MRHETKQRLNRLIWLRRAKFAAAALGVCAVAGVGLWYSGLDASVTTEHVAGVVQSVGSFNGANTRSIEQGLAVDVKLDNGGLAHVVVLKTSHPQVGDHVEIAKHIHGSGRTTYSWK